MLAVLASVVLGSIFGAQAETAKVAVIAGASAVVDGNEALEAVPAADQAAAEQLLRDGDVEAIVVPSASDPLGITVIGLDSPPTRSCRPCRCSPRSSCSTRRRPTRASPTSSPSASASCS